MTNYEVILKTDFRGELLCESCYGQSYWAGSGFTDWECDKCHGKHTHSNTATPKTCLGCSINTGKCQRCDNNVGKNLTLVPKKILNL